MKSYSPILARSAGAIAALALGASLITAADYPSTVLSEGPVAYYRFSDGVTAPVTDQAINSGALGAAANGNYNGATHPVPGALVGSPATAARFTGGQNVSIAYTPALNPAGAFTVEGWFRPAAANGAGVLTCAIASGHIASPRSGWLIYQSDTGWNWRTYNQNGTAVAVSITGGGAPVVGNWYHVVAVWDGAVGRLYVNGVLAATSGATTFVANPDAAFTIGMRSDGAFVWAGDADEAALYSTALSGAQIAAHYANGSSAAPVPSYDTLILADAPVGYWRLNEATFVPPVAANSGSLGAAAAGGYLGGATDGVEAPRAPQFIGFEPDNTALNLDGVNDFVRTIPGLLNGKPAFTLSGWIRRGADQAARAGIWGQNDIVEFGYINNSTLEVWTDSGLDIPNAIPNGEWAHLAIVSDGSPGTMTMYTNGAFAGSRVHTLPVNNTFAFNMGGGGIFDGAGNFFTGQMDEVAVFDKALSADRICNQYYAAIPNVPPFFLRQPVGTNIFEGDTLVLSASACGSGTVRYQWVFDFNYIPDATNSSYTITDAPVSAAGEYYVLVSNDYGDVPSDIVVVTVDPPPAPVISTQPQSITRYAGAKAVFRVVGTGGSRLRYQWQRDGVDIPGETNAMFMIAAVQPGDAADYRVVLSNAGGTTPSDVAALVVLTPAAGYETEVISGGPLAYWRLGETSGTVAHDYWGGNDGAYTDVTLGTGGAILDGDKAAEFNGTSSFVATPLSLNGATAFTMVGWIRRNADQADRTGLFGQNDLIEFGYINNNTLEVWTDNGLDISPNPIPNEEWAQVAVVSDGSPGTVTMYTNAEPAGSRAHVVPAANGFKFNIGGGGVFDAGGNFFNGRIDDLAVYGRALSQAEICALFVTGSGRYARPCCNDEPTYTLVSGSTSSDEDSGSVSVADWVTDISAGPDEASQTVMAHLSNDNPALFSVQPALDASGALTYTPALHACGSATVTFYLTDDGGTGACGDDTSATNTFTIAIRSVNDCPVAGSQSVNVLEGGLVDIALVYYDVDTNGCGNSIVSVTLVDPPLHGALSGSFPNLRYTPTNCYPGPCGHAAGPDGFSYQVWDGLCSVTGVVSITVIDVNKCPIPMPLVTPKCILPAMEGEIQVYISPNNSNTCLIFDGMLSSDPDCDTLTYSWTVGIEVFSTAMLATNTLPVGHHEIRLTVDDGSCDEGASIFINVITACEAIEVLMTDIDANSSMTTSTTAQHGSTSKAEKESRKCRRPLLSSLKSACKAFERGKFKEGLKKMRQFQYKLRDCAKKGYVVEAARWWAAAEVIIDSIECGQELHEKTHSKRTNDNHTDDDNDDTTKPWSNSHTPTHNPKTDKHWRSHEHHSHD